MTNLPNIGLGFSTADAVTILITGKDKNDKTFIVHAVIGANNCTIMDLILRAIESEYCCKPQDLAVITGHYAKSRYYVDEKIRTKYCPKYEKTFLKITDTKILHKQDEEDYYKKFQITEGIPGWLEISAPDWKYIFDFTFVIIEQLKSLGVPESHIHNKSKDFFLEKKFSSFRKNKYILSDLIHELDKLLKENISENNFNKIINIVKDVRSFFNSRKHLIAHLNESENNARSAFNKLISQISYGLDNLQDKDLHTSYKIIKDFIIDEGNLFKFIELYTNQFTPRNLSLVYIEELELNLNESKPIHN